MTNSKQLAARLGLAAVAFAGPPALGLALMSPQLEWRFVAMSALAFLVSGQAAEIRRHSGRTAVHLPLTHCVLFASSLALGPVGSALPGAFNGIARLLSGESSRQPLSEVIYTVLKPSAVCSCAALAYVKMGGSVLCPGELSSAAAVTVSACAYVAANAVLMEITGTPDAQEAAPVSRAAALGGSWLVCLMSGYALAAIYAFASTCMLFAPIVAMGIIRLALREPAVREQTDAQAEGTVEAVDGVEAEMTTEAPDDVIEFVDRLTGLANQRYLDMFLGRELSRCERTGTSLSAAIFELGQFDKLAESKKRRLAEEALVEMGNRLSSGLREYDLVARYAAGRLIVVLPGTPAKGAFEVAQRMHESLASLEMNRMPVSVTVGLAAFPEDGATADDLINSCHRALNRGKFEGENGVYGVERLAKAG